MAEITAAMVKQLREMTDAGMMECKKALVEADGDLEKAVDVLRTRGLAAAAKKAGRATNEGLIYTLVCSKCGKAAAMVEVNCETDFVSSNEKFHELCDKIAKTVLMQNPADVEALNACTVQDGEGTISELMVEAIHVIGENMQIARFIRVGAELNKCDDYQGAVSSYVHLGGKIGIVAEFGFDNEATAEKDEFKAMAKDICMQVAAASPVSVDQDSVPQDIIDHEMAIYKAQAAESGKPEAIQEKIASGRMSKFFKESCLMNQDFIKDTEKTVEAYVKEVSKACGDNIVVKSFVRFNLGETAAE